MPEPIEPDNDQPALFFVLFQQIYTSLLLIVGLPGNIISGYIVATDQLNRKTTRILMAIIATADSAVLLTAVTRYWSLEILQTDFRNYSDLICKIHVFLVAFFTDFAVGALCAVAVERFLVVAFPQRVSTVTSPKAVIIGMFSFAVALMCKNGIHFFLMRLEIIEGDSNATKYVCKPNEDYNKSTDIFKKVDFFSFAVLPYVILFSCNIYIFCRLKRQRKLLSKALNQRRKDLPERAASLVSFAYPSNFTAVEATEISASKPEQPMNSRQQRSTKSFSISGNTGKVRKRKPEEAIKILTALTVVHVVCTLPGTIFTLLAEYADLKKHKLTKNILVMLIFTNNAINVFAYLASSERFRQQFAALFSCGRIRHKPGR